MSGKMLKVPCTDRRNIMTRKYPGKVFSQTIKYLFSFQMLAWLWRGPFKLITKITDVTYKINCDRKGKPQVIHVDRIRKKYPQNLPGEESEQIESYEETVATDDLPNESMKKRQSHGV